MAKFLKDPIKVATGFLRKSRRPIGILLLAISFIGLFFLYFDVGRYVYADYPCYGFGSKPTKEASRISYGITIIHRNVTSGGGCWSKGESAYDLVIGSANYHLPTITIHRENDTIFVYDTPLKIGESHNWQNAVISVNPWVIDTVTFKATNNGYHKNLGSGSTIDVIGEIREGWFPSPLGIIMIVAGYFLVRKKNGDNQ
jgi:hypothetical protein